MLKSKLELEAKLLKYCKQIVFNKDKTEEVKNIMFEKFNIPMGFTMDMIAQRVTLSEQNEFVLFCLSYSIYEVIKTRNIVKQFYTELEIKTYSELKYEVDSVEFPIKIKCVQVSNDQWIGVADVNFIMKLRDAQLINYNTNAQRTMTRVAKGKNEYYKISLNNFAVKKIRESLKDNTFIPNTITLNIDDTNDFYYDNNKSELIINDINAFDISDGYHRYIAMCQEKDIDYDFNYPVELRITSFPEYKMKQFIFQEDQKTQMKKISSNSMNMNEPSNITLERLNDDILFEYKGQVTRNDGKIPFAELSEIVKFFYFKNTKKEEERITIKNAELELRTIFNLVSNSEDLNNIKFDFIELFVIIATLKYRNGNYTKIDCLIKDAIIAVKNDKTIYIRKNKKATVPLKEKVFQKIEEVDSYV